MINHFFTSESVTEGHPDKVCDQISDAVLDAIIANDKTARVACETSVTTGLVLLMGEITTNCYVDISKIARKVICEIGYDRPEYGFDGNSCAVITAINEQSADIAMGVDKALEVKEGIYLDENDLGAGDQGMMFGYACDETEELMPMPISLSHKLAKKLSETRKTNILPYLRPDGKTQVTIEYIDGKPARVDTIVLSTQHNPEIGLTQIRADVQNYIINPIFPEHLIDKNTKVYINPTGRFVIGGPAGDSGLTGRKIIVDTYGGYSRHGGGSFSGKDPTKVDRSAAYAARYVAKNIVKAGLASRCELQLAYAIGVSHPVSIMVDTFGTNNIDEAKINKIIKELFDLRPISIINMLNLRSPIYRNLAAYGHMGREDLGVSWEMTDMVEAIKRLI